MPRLIRFLTRDWLAGLACLAGTLWSYSRNLGFSFQFHADETGKLAQLVSGDWNFNHPMLTLTGTRVVAALCRIGPENEHGLVLCGRWLGVAFCALAAMFLVLAAHRLRGPWVAWALVPLFWFHAKLFHYAHYLKEDPALLFGICATVFAAVCYFQKGRQKYLDLAAVSCGLAASAKYIGILVPLVFLPFFWFARPRSGEAVARLAGTGRLLALAGLVFVVVNAPMLGGLQRLRANLGDEITAATDVTKARPERRRLYFRDMTRPVQERLPYLLAVYAVILALRVRRPRNAGETLALALLVAFTTTVLLTPKTADRYLLPYYALGTFFAGLGLGDAAHLVAKFGRGRRAARVGAVLLALVVLVPAVRENLRRWRHENDRFTDSGGRLELAGFIRSHLPPGAFLLYSTRVALPDPVYPQQYPGIPFLPQQVRFDPCFRGFATLAGLREAGVTHLVLTGKEEKEGLESGASRLDVEFYRSVLGQSRTLWRQRSSSARTAFPTELILLELPDKPKP